MNKILGIILVLAVVALGAWFFMSQGNSQDGEAQNDASQEEMQGSDDTATGAGSEGQATLNYQGLEPGEVDADGNIVVLYTGSGFYPAELQINAGDVVRFINVDNLALIVEGIEYQGAEAYQDFLSPRALGYGEDYVFTFTETGTWGYRNQLAKTNVGAVVVFSQQ